MTAARHSSPSSTAADFRQLTPWVLATALSAAQTVVCEPFDQFYLEAPAETLNRLLTLLARSGTATKESIVADGVVRLEGHVTSERVQGIQQQLPGLTSGMGTIETSFHHYAPATDPQRSRKRSRIDPFNGREYLLRLSRKS